MKPYSSYTAMNARRIKKPLILDAFGGHVPSLNTVTLMAFQVAAFYMAIPLGNLPVVGLSLSAPLLAFVALQVVFYPPEKWSKKYGQWTRFALLIWVGIFISAFGNGLVSGGVISLTEILYLFRYAFWLLIFVVTAYVVSRASLGERILQILMAGVFVLAALRWFEAIYYGRLGSGIALGKIFFFQNEYGFYFSSFAPLLLVPLITGKGFGKFITIVAMFFVLSAAVINGSRGSWVSISFGILLFIFLYLRVTPGSIGRLFPIILIVGMFFAGTLLFPKEMVSAVNQRYSSLQSLDEEKSVLIRQLMIQKAWRLFESNPLLGVGPGQFTRSYTELDIPYQLRYESAQYFNEKSAHNSYLALLAETGLVGVLPYVIIMSSLIARGYKAAIELAKRNQFWGMGIYVSFLAMSLHMTVISALTTTSTWMMYGFVAAMIMYPVIDLESEDRLHALKKNKLRK